MKRPVIFLLLLSSLVLFFNLGTRSLWEPDEGRYAEISREMAESGDWLTPRQNYIKHFDKPPITYWLIGASLKVFGQNEAAAHLPLVLLALTGVLVVFLLGKSLFGEKTGFLSAAILISCLGYPGLARVLSTDIVLTFFTLCCYLFFVRKRYLLFFLFMGLAFMTKGPIMLMLVFLPVCVFIFWERQNYSFKEIPWGRGLLIFALTALPWYIYEIKLNKGLLNDWFFQQTVNRIIRANQQPFYFFIPVLLGFLFPWTFFLPLALKKAFADKKRSFLLLFWFLLPFIFFSCIGKKLVPYILPLLAPLAILIARVWDEAIENSEALSAKGFAVSFYVLLSFLGLLFISFIVFLTKNFHIRLGVENVRPNVVFMCLVIIACIAAGLYAFKLKKVKWLFVILVSASVLFFLTSVQVLSKIEVSISKAIKPLAMKIKEDLRPGDKVVNYRCFLRGLPFYLGRRTIVVERQRNTTYEENPADYQDYLLEDKEDLYRLLSQREVRVYCITYTWEFEKIKQEYKRPLSLLGEAGKYVLFVNK